MNVSLLKKVSPQEFDIGTLLSNDELFELAKKRLDPQKYDNPKLRNLVQLVIEKGNKIETLIQHDKELAVYAMQLINHVLNWTMLSKNLNQPEKDESQKKDKLTTEEGLIRFLPKWQQKYYYLQEYKDLAEALNRRLTTKLCEETKRNLIEAKAAFEQVCDYLERNLAEATR